MWPQKGHINQQKNTMIRKEERNPSPPPHSFPLLHCCRVFPIKKKKIPPLSQVLPVHARLKPFMWHVEPVCDLWTITTITKLQQATRDRFYREPRRNEIVTIQVFCQFCQQRGALWLVPVAGTQPIGAVLSQLFRSAWLALKRTTRMVLLIISMSQRVDLATVLYFMVF